MDTTTPFPVWLENVASLSLFAGALCSAVVVVDLIRRPAKMWIMNLVWPLTALFGSVFSLALYRAARGAKHQAGDTPMPLAVAKAASHCGAGCTLGDLLAEWAAFAWPALATWFGWHTLFAEKTFAVWILDLLLAFLFGIAFQYFTIVPMRKLSPRQGIVQAIKADAASITAWQIGMYGAMALAQFAWLKPSYGAVAPVDSPVFWFVMQLAMLAGFATAYPVNWLLVSSGVKERM